MTDAKTKNDQLVALLRELQPGFLPYDIFVELARLTVLSIIEFVPLRRNAQGITEVLLLAREADDPLWPSELHVPGTVIRPTDTQGKIYAAFERILSEELAGTKTSSPHHVSNLLHKSKRGTEQAQVFWVEVLEEPKIGKFYTLNEFPDNVMHSQLDFIKQAAHNFENFTV